jgi:hypothetical protein
MDYQDYPMPLINYGKQNKSKQLRVFQQSTYQDPIKKDYNNYPGYSSFNNDYDKLNIIVTKSKSKKWCTVILIIISIIMTIVICILIAWSNKML